VAFGNLIQPFQHVAALPPEPLVPSTVARLIDSNLKMRINPVAQTARTHRRRQASRSSPAANRIFDDALSLAATLAEGRKQAGADRIIELASATRDFGARLDEFPQLRSYSDAAADNLDEFADYVARTEISDMIDDFASFARRQPMAALTLGVAAGLAVTQLMHGWPVPTSSRRSSNGRQRKRARRNGALH
jgi:hypothetical protein